MTPQFGPLRPLGAPGLFIAFDIAEQLSERLNLVLGVGFHLSVHSGFTTIHTLFATIHQNSPARGNYCLHLWINQ